MCYVMATIRRTATALDLDKAPIRAYWHAAPASAMQPILSQYAHGTVIDLCCGTGNIAIEAALNGASVIGIDNNPFAVFLARQFIASAALHQRLETFLTHLLSQETLRALYRTHCPSCGQSVEGRRFLWRDGAVAQIAYRCSCSNDEQYKVADPEDIAQASDLSLRADEPIVSPPWSSYLSDNPVSFVQSYWHLPVPARAAYVARTLHTAIVSVADQALRQAALAVLASAFPFGPWVVLNKRVRSDHPLSFPSVDLHHWPHTPAILLPPYIELNLVWLLESTLRRWSSTYRKLCAYADADFAARCDFRIDDVRAPSADLQALADCVFIDTPRPETNYLHLSQPWTRLVGLEDGFSENNHCSNGSQHGPDLNQCRGDPRERYSETMDMTLRAACAMLKPNATAVVIFDLRYMALSQLVAHCHHLGLDYQSVMPLESNNGAILHAAVFRN